MVGRGVLSGRDPAHRASARLMSCADPNTSVCVVDALADRISEAFERVLASDVRYRFVVDTSTPTRVTNNHLL